MGHKKNKYHARKDRTKTRTEKLTMNITDCNRPSFTGVPQVAPIPGLHRGPAIRLARPHACALLASSQLTATQARHQTSGTASDVFKAVPQDPPDTRPWFEKAVFAPHTDIGTLLPDPWLKKTLQQPEESQLFYQQEVARRKQLQAAGQGDKYTFQPFMVTLGNMKKLTQHILSNQQFETPLAPDERQAFTALEEHIETLMAQRAPYTRTLYLAILMACLQEIVTVRRVVPVLREEAPRLFGLPSAIKRLQTSSFSAVRDGEKSEHLEAQDIPLSSVMSCNWGGLNPEGADEKLCLFSNWPEFRHWFPAWLEDPEMFLYPALEPLDPEDFCRLGHHPIYPLGMMTAHALNADGYMMTALRFLQHDLSHTYVRTLKNQETNHPLKTPADWLQFRQLLMDRVPPELQGEQMNRALQLIVFHLFHEASKEEACRDMNADSFLPLLQKISIIRRVRRCGYPALWQKIRDNQALLACLWAHKLYKHWSQNPTSQTDILQPLRERFVHNDGPSLLNHWRFLHTHLDVLQRDFCRQSTVIDVGGGHASLDYEIPCLRASGIFPLRWREEHNYHAEGSVDHTDVLYFALLHSAQGRQLMARATQHELPAGAF